MKNTLAEGEAPWRPSLGVAAVAAVPDSADRNANPIPTGNPSIAASRRRRRNQRQQLGAAVQSDSGFSVMSAPEPVVASFAFNAEARVFTPRDQQDRSIGDEPPDASMVE